MKQLYVYTSYRSYLSDYYQAMKAQSPGFSYQHFSRLAGLKSPNYLKLVMDGGRDLTVTNIHQFAKALKLTEAETEFFEALVFLEQASSPLEKSYYKTRLSRLKSVRIERQRQVKVRRLAEFPYLPAILVCANGMEQDSAAKTLAAKLGLEEKEVEKVIERLQEHEMLEEADGRLRITEDYFIQFDKIRSNADQKNFLKSQLRLSEEALKNRYETDAQFFAHTFTTLPSRTPGMIQRLASLLEEITQESNDDPPENVMQLNIQFFPLGK